MATVTVPVALGGTNTTYRDDNGANGMKSSNGYGYRDYLMPMLSEVIGACQTAVNSGTQAQSMQSLFNRIYLGGY